MTYAPSPLVTHIAFSGSVRIAAGDLAAAALAAQTALAADPAASVLVFDAATAELVDLDLRGDAQDLAARYAPRTPREDPAPARRGRPKLGVAPREVTLLPRHWEWLAAQPGGASAALRRLVEAARKADAGADRARIEVAYRFMAAMAGNLPRFEDAARALFAGDRAALSAITAGWPADIAAAIDAFLSPRAEAAR